MPSPFSIILRQYKWLVTITVLVVLVLVGWVLIFQDREIAIGPVKIGKNQDPVQPPAPSAPGKSTESPQPRQPMKTTGQGSLPPQEGPPKRLGNLIGSWSGSRDCVAVFSQDDGNNIGGSCDNSGYRHKIIGRYTDEDHIAITITRTDPQGCSTTVEGSIVIKDKNTLAVAQEGWNGCGVRTGSGQTILTRM